MHGVRSHELPTLIPYPVDDTATGLWLERLKDRRHYTDLYVDSSLIRHSNEGRQVAYMSQMPALPDINKPESMTNTKWLQDAWDTVHKVNPADYRTVYALEQTSYNKAKIANMLDTYT